MAQVSGVLAEFMEWCSTCCAYSFMGSNQFCFKICDPAGSNPAGFCQHIYDRIGVSYNCPTAVQNGTFEYCEGESQDPPGIYTDASGAVQTYTQPPESLGVITTLPYQPRVPASSNCVQIPSAALFTDLAAPTGSSTASGSGSSVTGTARGSGSGAAGTATRSGASAGASSTGAASGDSNGAAAMRVSAAATVAGVLAAVAFLA